jgi:hypothetical protein
VAGARTCALGGRGLIAASSSHGSKTMVITP